MLVVEEDHAVNLAAVLEMDVRYFQHSDKNCLRFYFQNDATTDIDFDTIEEATAALDKIVADFEAGKAVCRL